VRYRLVAVGSLKRGPLAEAAERYARLLRGLAALEVVEVKDRSALGPPEARSRHAAESLRHADGHLLLLDERGEQLTTAELAERVTGLERAGVSRLTLFLGGPDGHGAELRAAAHGALALSRLTLPHDLARVVLLEQLYRVEALRSGHPYHRA
jgi:23S rRNA (pseudouridine1915-N3)-methyltransferase